MDVILRREAPGARGAGAVRLSTELLLYTRSSLHTYSFAFLCRDSPGKRRRHGLIPYLGGGRGPGRVRTRPGAQAPWEAGLELAFGASLRETRAGAAAARVGLAAWFALGDVTPGSARASAPHPVPPDGASPRGAPVAGPGCRRPPTALPCGKAARPFPLIAQGPARAAAPGAPPRTREDRKPRSRGKPRRTAERAGVLGPRAALSPLRAALLPEPEPPRQPSVPRPSRADSRGGTRFLRVRALPSLVPPDSPRRAGSPGSAPRAPRSSGTSAAAAPLPSRTSADSAPSRLTLRVLPHRTPHWPPPLAAAPTRSSTAAARSPRPGLPRPSAPPTDPRPGCGPRLLSPARRRRPRRGHHPRSQRGEPA